MLGAILIYMIVTDLADVMCIGSPSTCFKGLSMGHFGNGGLSTKSARRGDVALRWT